MIPQKPQQFFYMKIILFLFSVTPFTFGFVQIRAFKTPNKHNSMLHESSTATNYDIVKVDLTGGRDYPIYIGAGFSDEEGI